MHPNPFQVWGFTGITSASAPPSTHRRRRLHLLPVAGGGLDHAGCDRPASKPSCRVRCLHCSSQGLRPGRSLQAAAGDTLPVQGRVSVREQQLDDPSGSSSTAGSLPGTDPAPVPGSVFVIDDEISAEVPAAPANQVGASELSRPAAPADPTPTSGVQLPASIAGVFRPIAIALGATVACGACIVRVLYHRHRRQQKKVAARDTHEQALAGHGGSISAQPLRDVYWVHVKRPSWRLSDPDTAPPRRRVSLYQPSQVLPTVQHTSVQAFDTDDESGADCSFGSRAVLPPLRDTLSDC